MVEETKQVAEAAGVLGTLGIDGKLFFAQLINFSVVLLVMWRWVYRPLVKIMDDRAKKIEQGLKDADSSAALKKLAEEEKAKIVMEARVAAKAIAEDAERTAVKQREETIKKTRQEVEGIVAQGRDQLRTEKEAMVAEAKAEVAGVVVLAVEKIAGEKLDARKDEKLIRESIGAASKK